MTVDRPIRPQPCNVGVFPKVPPVEFHALDVSEPEDETPDVVVTSPVELEALAAWVQAVGDWRKNVEGCPWVATTNLPDLQRSL